MHMLFKTVLSAAALTLLSTSAGEQDATKWRISNQLPATSPLSRGLELWKTKMEEAGKGRISVETHHNSQLYKDSEVFPAVQSGSVEMGVVIIGQLSAYDRIFVFDLPGLIQSYDQFAKASKGKLGQTFSERLEKLGVYPIYWPLQGSSRSQPLIAI